jgi:hypothetical protein
MSELDQQIIDGTKVIALNDKISTLNDLKKNSENKIEFLKSEIIKFTGASQGAIEVVNKLTSFTVTAQQDLQAGVNSGKYPVEVANFVISFLNQMLGAGKERANDIDRGLYAKQGELIECNNNVLFLSDLVSKAENEIELLLNPPQPVVENQQDVVIDEKKEESSEENKKAGSLKMNKLSKVWNNLVNKKQNEEKKIEVETPVADKIEEPVIDAEKIVTKKRGRSSKKK